MIFDYQEKEQEIERMKEEMTSLKDKLKLLNKKFKAVKKDENNKSVSASLSN